VDPSKVMRCCITPSCRASKGTIALTLWIVARRPDRLMSLMGRVPDLLEKL
jgi:hypothetical protein